MIRLLAASLFLAFSVICFAGPDPNSQQPADVPAMHLGDDGKVLQGWLNRHQQNLAAARQGRAQLVFLGDSITAQWTNSGIFNSEFGRYTPVNFGIGGDRTQHVLWRVQNGAFDILRPRVVVLMIGTNNSPGPGNSADEIARGITRIIGEIHKQSPDTVVVLFSIFPREDAAPLQKITEVNAIISRLHDGRRVQHMDIAKALLLGRDRVSTEVFRDGLHLTAKGYQIWADALRPRLAAIWSGSLEKIAVPNNVKVE